MNQLEIQKKYEEHLPLLNKMARKWSNIYQVEFEEIFGQACLIFVECTNNYDSKKSKFSTFLFKVLDNNLKKYANKLSQQGFTSEVPENIYQDCIEEIICINDCLNNLSTLAKKMVKLCFDPFSLLIYSNGLLNNYNKTGLQYDVFPKK